VVGVAGSANAAGFARCRERLVRDSDDGMNGLFESLGVSNGPFGALMNGVNRPFAVPCLAGGCDQVPSRRTVGTKR
jgi:hypothetical protein